MSLDKQPIRKHQIHKQPKQKSTYDSITDSTVNLEILEQLKQLGNEIRGKQEQLIKHVVEKQLTKKVQPEYPQNQCNKVDYSYEYDNDNDELEEPQPTFKSRIRR